MLMSSPALAFGSKEETKSVGGTILDVILNMLAENWLMVMMIAIIVICFIVVLKLASARPMAGITYEQSMAMAMYSGARLKKLLILDGKKMRIFTDSLSSRLKLEAKVDTLSNEIVEEAKSKNSVIRSRNISNDPTMEISQVDDFDFTKDNIETILGRKTINLAKQEEYRTAIAKLEKAKMENGSTKKLKAKAIELKGLDEIIERCWSIIKQTPGFHREDFKFPGD